MRRGAKQSVERQVIYDFCQIVIDTIIIAGGELQTAYKCAAAFAKDMEDRNGETMPELQRN